ncbi:MAG: 7-cyano-7-deazaguanine synthase [Candidatus Diapherotrites archaeon]|nr:7-cyano-7-deazaguanine synthase [Candidatus Diapherotrites archaeon]
MAKQAKAIVLISGGIDSVVAAALALEQGLDVVALHYSTATAADNRAEKKTKMLVQHIATRFKKKIKLIVVPYGAVLQEIAGNCQRRLNCVLCKRMMMRIAVKIALREGADCLIMGDSLGQVASQTLSNLNAEHNAAKIAIIKPLLGMDKLEIERISRKFGTFELSIMPAACCGIPDKPATAAKAGEAEAEEEKIAAEEIAGKAAASAETVVVEP